MSWYIFDLGIGNSFNNLYLTTNADATAKNNRSTLASMVHFRNLKVL